VKTPNWILCFYLMSECCASIFKFSIILLALNPSFIFPFLVHIHMIGLLIHEYWFSMQFSSCDIFLHGIFPSNLWPWQYFFAHFFWGRFQILRNLIPQNDQKRDKASFLLEVFQLVMFWFYNFILEISSYGSKLTLEAHKL